jgi:hypothetical protein
VSGKFLRCEDEKVDCELWPCDSWLVVSIVQEKDENNKKARRAE